jgi:hypothetical protein
MIWFYERNKLTLRVEIRYDSGTDAYVAILDYPDRRAEERRFATLEELRFWLSALEATLRQERWTSTGPPVLLPYGWREPDAE